MSLLFRMLAPKPLKKARRIAHPVSLVTPRAVRRAKMGAVNLANPAGAVKRKAKSDAVRLVRGRRNARQSDGGALGALIVGLLVVGLAVYVGMWLLSVPGHVLGLTPTGHELWSSKHGYVNQHYEHVVWGCLITVADLTITVIGLPWAISAARTDSDPIRPWAYFLTVLLLVGVVTVLVPVGKRPYPLAHQPTASLTVDTAP